MVQLLNSSFTNVSWTPESVASKAKIADLAVLKQRFDQPEFAKHAKNHHAPRLSVFQSSVFELSTGEFCLSGHRTQVRG